MIIELKTKNSVPICVCSVFFGACLLLNTLFSNFIIYTKMENTSEDDKELSFVNILIKRLILLDLFKNENLCVIMVHLI